MELKKWGMRKKDLIQNNKLIIYKNGAQEVLRAKERINTK